MADVDWLSDDRMSARLLHALDPGGLAAWREIASAPHRAWAEAHRFSAKAGEILTLPGAEGAPASALIGVDGGVGGLKAGARGLPEGSWRLAATPGDPTRALAAWGLGAYSFDRYRKEPRAPARLVAPGGADTARAIRIVEGCRLARDLVDTPAEEMGPEELATAAATLAAHHDAEIKITIGDELIAENYPLIHAVGRASARAPRLIDLTWGDPSAPKVTLVGKGVCFDSGGLDIKSAAGMRIMKKDMGGGAHVLGLAHMIMDADLPVRLRALIPAVENAISGAAFRPGDVLKSRKGLTVEIGNTDAEGRLVLADALAEGDADAPDLMIDLATLTGAARVALGPDLPPFYTDNDALAGVIATHAEAEADPVWRMPLWRGYDRDIDSPLADVDNTGQGGFAGSITAALFLARFVENRAAWAHFDIYAWAPSARPGQAKGSSAQAIRGLYAMLEARYRASAR